MNMIVSRMLHAGKPLVNDYSSKPKPVTAETQLKRCDVPSPLQIGRVGLVSERETSAVNQLTVTKRIEPVNSVRLNLTDEISPGEYLQVKVADEQSVIRLNALIDTGAQLSICPQRFVHDLKFPYVGQVQVRGISEQPLMLELYQIDIKLDKDAPCAFVPIICAVSPDIKDELILTSKAADTLRQHLGCTDTCVHATRVNNEVEDHDNYEDAEAGAGKNDGNGS